VSRWPPEITGSLEPRPEEIAGLQPPATPGWCAEATAPSAAEVQRLMAHAARAPSPRRSARPILAWALVTALLLLGLAHLLPLPGDPQPVAGVATLGEGNILHFGPSITVSGVGEIEVLRADEQGTALALLAGEATFEVDPDGERRQLDVHAGELRVEVTGTRFVVAIDDDRVRVEVLRGSVRVHRPGDSLSLGAGEHWSGPKRQLAAALGTTPEPRAPNPGIREPNSEPPTPIPETRHPIPEIRAPSTTHPAAGSSTAPDTPSSTDATTAAQAWASLLEARATSRDPEAQLSALDSFLSQHPDPVLGPEAGALRLELLAELLPGEEVMPDVDAWLAHHPQHARSLEVELLRATVAREQLDDCALAMPSYARVAREASGSLQANAQAWLEHCRGQAR
jgi:hypothetical protein